jgi:DNA-binding MarR family transcriptional regulator
MQSKEKLLAEMSPEERALKLEYLEKLKEKV